MTSPLTCRRFAHALLGGLLLLAVLSPATPARADDLAGKGGIGFSLGFMRYTGNEDFSTDAGIRPMLRVSARYVWQQNLTTTLDAGYGWNAYGDGGDFRGPDTTGTLAVVTPINLGMEYRFATAGRVIPRFGAGIGVYPFAIRAGRDRISRDRINYKDRRKSAFGGYAKFGAEYPVVSGLALNGDLLYHLAPMSDETRFPGGYFDAAASFVEFRVGLNYYFTIRQTGASPEGQKDAEDEE